MESSLIQQLLRIGNFMLIVSVEVSEVSLTVAKGEFLHYFLLLLLLLMIGGAWISKIQLI